MAAANAGIAAASGSVIQVLNNDTEVTPGWAQAGLAPFADATVGSVAPLVLVRSDPSRVDSAGDRFAVFGWPSKRGHGQDAGTWMAHPSGPVFGASGSSAFYRARALETVGAYDPAFGSYYEDVDLAFRLRWAGYSCVFEPSCRILHEVSASYDHTRPDLQRRMARNAELLFWTDLPAAWLIAALVPHLGFTCLQALWRFARGRARPFLAGKLDARAHAPRIPPSAPGADPPAPIRDRPSALPPDRGLAGRRAQPPETAERSLKPSILTRSHPASAPARDATIRSVDGGVCPWAASSTAIWPRW